MSFDPYGFDFDGFGGYGGFDDGRPWYGSGNAVSQRAQNALTNAQEAAKSAIVNADTSKGKAVFDIEMHLVAALRPSASSRCRGAAHRRAEFVTWAKQNGVQARARQLSQEEKLKQPNGKSRKSAI